MLTYAQGADSRSSTCAHSTRKVSRGRPVGLLTASGARARARPAHCPSPLTTCASMGTGNPRNWSPGQSSQALAPCGGWRRSSGTPLRDRPVGLAAQIGRGGRGGLAAACRVSLFTRKKIITRRRPGRLLLRLRACGSSCSVGLRDYSWPVVCTSSASCQAHSEGDHTVTMSCVSAARAVVSQAVLLRIPVAEPYSLRQRLFLSLCIPASKMGLTCKL